MIKILLLCLISTRIAVSQNVSWTVGTSVPTFKNELKLVCTVSSDCCTSFPRIWEDAAGTQILYDDISSSPNKYQAEWDGSTTGFNLIIKDLQQSDVGDYKCQYRVGEDKHTLTQDVTWEYHPTEKHEINYRPFALGQDFTYHIAKAAPYPSVKATIGGKNVSAGLTVAGPTKFDTWFYSLNVSIDTRALCKEETEEEDKKFLLFVTTGTKTKEVSEGYLCFPCWKCGLHYVGWSSFGLIVGYFLAWIYFYIGFKCSCCNSCWSTRRYFCYKNDTTTCHQNHSKLYGRSYTKARRNRALLISSAATLVGHMVFYCVIFALLIGINCPSCEGNTEVAVFSFVAGGLCFLFIFFVALKIFNGYEDASRSIQWMRFTAIMLCSLLIFTIPIMAVIYMIWMSVKVTEAINGRDSRLLCPYEDNSGKITWIKLKDGDRTTYSEGTDIDKNLLQDLRYRLKVDGQDLCITDVQESDAGIYECVLSPKPNKVPRASKLKLIVLSAGKEKKPTPV